MKVLYFVITSLLLIITTSDALVVSLPTITKNKAIISDINIKNLSKTDKIELKRLFDTIPLIIFKNQKISPKEHYEFCKIFDEYHNNNTIHEYNTYSKTTPQVAVRGNFMISKNVHGGIGYEPIFKNNYVWRQDMVGSNKHLPPIVSSFHILRVPNNNCYQTRFASLEDAYDDIDMILKKELQTYKIIYENDEERIYLSNWDSSGYVRKDISLEYDEMNNTTYPLFVYSDSTKYRKSIMINPMKFLKFKDLSFDESNDLFRYIMRIILNKRNVIEYKWQQNDLIIFNNRKLIYTLSPTVEYDIRKKILYTIVMLGTNEPLNSCM